MSQELIGIVGASTVALALATPVHAQVDCADWNTAAFFEAAEVSDVTRCLQAGANLEAGDDELGFTPLHWSAMSGTIEAVTALLEAGADPKARSEYGFIPLHLAARSEIGEAVTALLEAGANLESSDKRGWTPLHLAAMFGTDEAMTALLEAGADPNARDNDGNLPFDYARDNEQLKGTDAYWKLNDARFQ